MLAPRTKCIPLCSILTEPMRKKREMKARQKDLYQFIGRSSNPFFLMLAATRWRLYGIFVQRPSSIVAFFPLYLQPFCSWSYESPMDRSGPVYTCSC